MANVDKKFVDFAKAVGKGHFFYLKKDYSHSGGMFYHNGTNVSPIVALNHRANKADGDHSYYKFEQDAVGFNMYKHGVDGSVGTFKNVLAFTGVEQKEGTRLSVGSAVSEGPVETQGDDEEKAKAEDVEGKDDGEGKDVIDNLPKGVKRGDDGTYTLEPINDNQVNADDEAIFKAFMKAFKIREENIVKDVNFSSYDGFNPWLFLKELIRVKEFLQKYKGFDNLKEEKIFHAEIQRLMTIGLTRGTNVDSIKASCGTSEKGVALKEFLDKWGFVKTPQSARSLTLGRLISTFPAHASMLLRNKSMPKPPVTTSLPDELMFPQAALLLTPTSSLKSDFSDFYTKHNQIIGKRDAKGRIEPMTPENFEKWWSVYTSSSQIPLEERAEAEPRYMASRTEKAAKNLENLKKLLAKS